MDSWSFLARDGYGRSSGPRFGSGFVDRAASKPGVDAEIWCGGAALSFIRSRGRVFGADVLVTEGLPIPGEPQILATLPWL
jgi:hypothetical protein